METPRSDKERRAFIIHAFHDFYAAGCLTPAYVYAELEDMLESVVELLEEEASI